MDKTTIALAATEDNAAAIRELSKQVARCKTGCRLVDGTSVNGVTSFGNVTSDGGVGVFVKFVGTAVTLRFCGKDVLTSTAPLIAVLPSGSGELTLNVNRAAGALIIGG